MNAVTPSIRFQGKPSGHNRRAFFAANRAKFSGCGLESDVAANADESHSAKGAVRNESIPFAGLAEDAAAEAQSFGSLIPRTRFQGDDAVRRIGPVLWAALAVHCVSCLSAAPAAERNVEPQPRPTAQTLPPDNSTSTIPINAPIPIYPDPFYEPVRTGVVIGEDNSVPLMPQCPNCWQRLNPFYYMFHTTNYCAPGRHHGRFWKYSDGELHGYPYGCSPYQPKAAGASHTFPSWVPRRSFYYAYQPGGQGALPYGYSPEPYYAPQP